VNVRVVVDAMGGDFAPKEAVAGAVLAAKHLSRCEIILVGRESEVEPELATHKDPPQLRIVHAPDVIGMKDNATDAVRALPGASINVGLKLVKAGEADAFVTAGNTGATMAAAMLTLGRVRGISRPALGLPYATLSGRRKFLIDVGANADCRPGHLVQFAFMGAAFMERRYGVERPEVGLLSIGEEDSKGNLMTIEVNQMLRTCQLNFVGNVESKDILRDSSHIMVSDGFAGNVMLKTVEGVAESLFGEIRRAATSTPWNRLAALVLRPELRRVRDRLDYTEYGGVQLVGVEGVAVISHGRSNARAVFSAVRAARDAVQTGVVDVIREVGETMPGRRLLSADEER
jgi:glycerol-3-phosphate acyltransferase PlsX